MLARTRERVGFPSASGKDEVRSAESEFRGRR